MDIEEGTVALPDIKNQELIKIFNLTALQHHMVRKDLDNIIGKPHYIHLVVKGEVARIYHLQHIITQGEEYRVWIFPEFHQDLGDWHILVKQEKALPIHLADIMQG